MVPSSALAPQTHQSERACVPTIARDPLQKVVTVVTMVTAPETYQSEISVDIRTVTTIMLMTLNRRGSLKAVQPSPEMSDDATGRQHPPAPPKDRTCLARGVRA